MSEVDIKALADLPGAGQAERVVKEAGLWNEALGDGPRWWCTVDGSVRAQCTFQVRAATREEAREKAMRIAASGGDDVNWDFDHIAEPLFATAFEADK